MRLVLQVTPQGDGYYCEFDGKTYNKMERRYVLLLKASDATGEAYLNLFNDQVKFSSLVYVRLPS